MKKLSLTGSLAIVLAAVLWALDGVYLTPSLFHLDVVVVVFLLHLLPSYYMFAIVVAEKNMVVKMDRGDWVAIFLVALFGGAIGTLAITKALFYVNFVPLTIVVLLQKLQPVFAILMAILFLKEHPPKSFYLYALLALIGSYLLTFGFSVPVWDVGNNLLQAVGLSLLAAFSFGSATVFGKRALQNISFQLGTALRFLLTTLIMLVLVIALNKFTAFAAVEAKDLVMLLFIAVTTGGVAIFLYYFGLKKVLASQSTILELAFPATTILLDYSIRGTLLSWPQWLGIFVLLLAIIRITMLRVKTTGRK